jgi:serine/threonine-protein kinase RsbW
MPTLSLYADLSCLETVHAFVAQTGYDMGLNGQNLANLQMVVDEACANVVQHAYGGQGGEMVLSIEAVGSCLQVTIRDWGQPFDPDKVPVPDLTAPLERRPLGGLGVYLMREMMDQVDYHFDPDDGNTLVMVKRIPGLRSGKS